MRLHETDLDGVLVVEPERISDDRGFFARTWCARELEEAGLDPRLAQISISWNERAHTLRGLHFQAAPRPEAKLVRCTRGRIFDVAVDLRRDSPTYGRWTGRELSADDRLAMWVPAGFAHGFQTLVDDTEVLYLMSEFFDPDLTSGVRHDDPDIGIEWPAAERRTISERDRGLPLLRELTAWP